MAGFRTWVGPADPFVEVIDVSCESPLAAIHLPADLTRDTDCLPPVVYHLRPCLEDLAATMTGGGPLVMSTAEVDR